MLPAATATASDRIYTEGRVYPQLPEVLPAKRVNRPVAGSSPFRGGVFYDPAPADGKPDDYFGFSLGSGIAVGSFVFDMAYQYRFGKDVGESLVEGFDFSQDVEEHTVYMSIIIHL